MVSFCSFAQDSKWELWSKADFSYKLNKKISFSLEPGARYGFNPILFTKQFVDVSSSYRVKKTLILELDI